MGGSCLCFACFADFLLVVILVLNSVVRCGSCVVYVCVLCFCLALVSVWYGYVCIVFECVLFGFLIW